MEEIAAAIAGMFLGCVITSLIWGSCAADDRACDKVCAPYQVERCEGHVTWFTEDGGIRIGR